mmetsp:Transcript_4825/g.8279  ORF Transcript_4825/g.8279 Transcript_4825/m.8279 type:complete len:98 (+) Transcript_4825:928-1221(+)
MVAEGRCQVHTDSVAKSIEMRGDKVLVNLENGRQEEGDKVMTAVDGLELKKIVEQSASIPDQSQILGALSFCAYRNLATCNLIYTPELSKLIQAKFP